MFKNIEKPSTELQALLSEGVRRHGAAGLVDKMKMSWSIVLNASHGVAVQADRLDEITDKINLILGKERDVKKLTSAIDKMSLTEKKNLFRAIMNDLSFHKGDPEPEVLRPILERLTAERAGSWAPLSERGAV